MPNHYRHHWTIDREKDAFLEHVETGREEYSNRHAFVFYWKSELFEAKLDLSGSTSLNERPNKTIWEFVGIWPSQPKAATREKVLDILKEALTVRGYDGARRRLPDTIVEFMNF